MAQSDQLHTAPLAVNQTYSFGAVLPLFVSAVFSVFGLSIISTLFFQGDDSIALIASAAVVDLLSSYDHFKHREKYSPDEHSLLFAHVIQSQPKGTQVEKSTRALALPQIILRKEPMSLLQDLHQPYERHITCLFGSSKPLSMNLTAA
ncbi:unnamed protein product [Aphanomyces euteiches]